MWFHVDGAYGGAALCAPSARAEFDGIEHADSLIIDPHKGLFLPYGLGVTLVKNVQDLKRSYSFNASYMQDAFAAPDELSIIAFAMPRL